MDERPVGVFDSGVGGLTLLQELRKQLPSEHWIYVADSREAPYGTKTVAEIQERCDRIVDYLIEQDAKTVLVACNTASVSALAHLRERYTLPFVGTVPAVKPAAAMTRTGKIGVLATPTTADSRPLAQLIEQFTHGVTVMTQVCPGLVPLVERGVNDGPEAEALLMRYLDPLLEAGVDVIVLGCTHYPFLAEAIQRLCGPPVTLLDPASAVVRQLGRVLEREALARTDGPGHGSFATTGEREEFVRVLERLIGPFSEPVTSLGI
jgi:glutamate racemase